MSHYFALASIASYACSGCNGLYSSQRILYSGTKPEYINLRTNHNHLVKGRAASGLPGIAGIRAAMKAGSGDGEKAGADIRPAPGEADRIPQSAPDAGGAEQFAKNEERGGCGKHQKQQGRRI